jgi:hypothetical protein
MTVGGARRGESWMKKLVLIAAVAALSACNNTAAEPAAQPSAEAATTVAVDTSLATDGMPNAGTYEVITADGKVLTQTVNADGTFTSVKDGKTTKGTWTSTGPGNFCETEEGKTEPSCYAETISADKVWTSVNVKDPKDHSTVKRLS